MEKLERFSIRKLTVGVASVTIGFWFAGSGNIVHADTVDSNVNQTEVKTGNVAKTNTTVNTDQNSAVVNNKDTVGGTSNVVAIGNNKQSTGITDQNSIDTKNKVDVPLENTDSSKSDTASQNVNLADDGKTQTVNTETVDNKLVDSENNAKSVVNQKISNAHNNISSNDTKTNTDTVVANNNVSKISNLQADSKSINKSDVTSMETKQVSTDKTVNDTPWYTEQEKLDIAKENIVNGPLDEGLELEKNGGLDPSVWGTFDINDWDVGTITVKRPMDGRSLSGVALTGYHGDKDHIILPNSESVKQAHPELFKNVDSNDVYITSDFVHKLIMDDNPVTFAIRGNGANLVNADTDWSWAFARTNDKKTLLGDSRLTKVNIKNLFWGDIGVAHLDHMFDGDHIDTIANINFESMYNQESDANGHMLPITASAMFKGNNLKQLAGLSNDGPDGEVVVEDSDSAFDSFMQNVLDMSEMFANNQLYSLNGLISGGLGSSFIDRGVNADGMFINNQLTDLSNEDFLEYSNISSAIGMFENNNIYKLPDDFRSIGSNETTPTVNLSHMFNRNKLTKLPTMYWVVSPSTQIKSLDLTAMFANNQISDVSNVANWGEMVSENDNLPFGHVYLTDFLHNNQIEDVTPFADWNMLQVSDISRMFANNKISDLSPLAKWDISKLTSLSGTFAFNQLTNLHGLENWDTSKLSSIYEAFRNNKINDLSAVSNWNTSAIKDMASAFAGNTISDVSPLANWDTKNTVNMAGMLSGNQIADVSPLNVWKTSNLTDVSNMFTMNKLAGVNDLSNWDTSKVTRFGYTFSNNPSNSMLVLNNWDLTKATDLTGFDVTGPQIVSMRNVKVPKDADWTKAFGNGSILLTDNQALLTSDKMPVDTYTVNNGSKTSVKTVPIAINSNTDTVASDLKTRLNSQIADLNKLDSNYYVPADKTDVENNDYQGLLSLANANIKSAYSSVMYNFIDTATNQVVGKYDLGKVKAGADITIDKDRFKRSMPDHYYLDRNYDIPENIVASESTTVINVPVHKAYVYTITFYDNTTKKAYDTRSWSNADNNGNLTWDGIDGNKHLTGTVDTVNTWADNQINKLVYDKSDNYLSNVDISKLPPIATLGDISWYDKDLDMDRMIAKDTNGYRNLFVSLPEQDVEITVPFTHRFVDLTGYAPIFTPSSVYAENDENLKDFIKTLNSGHFDDPRDWANGASDKLDKLKVKWTSGGTLGGTWGNQSAFAWGSAGGYLGNPTYQWPRVSHIDKYLQNSVINPNPNISERPNRLDPTFNTAFGTPYMIPMSIKNYDLFDRKASESIHFDLSGVLPAVSEKHNGYHVEVLTGVYDRTTKRTKWELIPVNSTNVRDETSIFDLLNKELNITFGKTLDKSKISSLSDVDGELLNAIGGDAIRPNVNNLEIALVPTNTGRYEYGLVSSVDGLFNLGPTNILENPSILSENTAIDELVPYTSVMYREALKKAANQSNMSDCDYMISGPGIMNPSVMLYTIAPNDETATIKYIDDDTEEILKQDTIDGKFDSVISFATDPSNVISEYEKQGYKVVSNNYKSGVKFNSSNSFEIHLTKKIDNTINYVDKNGKVVKTDKITNLPGENIKLNIPDGYHIDGEVPSLVVDKDKSVQIVNISKNKQETGTSETITKDVLNIVNYVDENGKTIKTDHVTGKGGDKISVTIPDGYHIGGNIHVLTIDSNKPVQTVNVVKNQYDTDISETVNKDVLNIINYIDENGKTIKTDRVTGKDGDSIALNIPDGYHVDKLPKLTIKPDTVIQMVNVVKNIANTGDSLVDDKPTFSMKHETGDSLLENKPEFDMKHNVGDSLIDEKPAFDMKHETGDPLVNEKPSYDLDKLKKHETGDPLVDDKPEFDMKHETGDPLVNEKPSCDLDKLKKHETGNPLVDDKPEFDMQHETGEPSMDNKPSYNLGKLKKHETGDPLVNEKLSYDIDKLKKHGTGDPLVDDKPAYNLNQLKKYETDDLSTTQPEFEIKNNSTHSERKLGNKTYKNFVPVYTKQMRANTQVRKLVQSKEDVSRSTKFAKERTDKQIKKLPQAGAKQSLIPIIVGAISTMLASLGLVKRKKNK